MGARLGSAEPRRICRAGEMKERDGMDDDGTAFYAVDCNRAAPFARDFVGNE